MRVELGMLGPFTVRIDGVATARSDWARRDSASLVKVLALSEGRQRHREQVIDLLWPDLDLDSAGPRLHKAAHYARRALRSGDAVVLREGLVTLLPGHQVTVDLLAFEAAAATALESGSRSAAEAVLDAHVGEALPGDRYEPWRRNRVTGWRCSDTACCDRPAAGRRSWRATRWTRRPTWRWCPGSGGTATSTALSSSTSAWIAPSVASWRCHPARRRSGCAT
jgi:hypothetical protein